MAPNTEKDPKAPAEEATEEGESARERDDAALESDDLSPDERIELLERKCDDLTARSLRAQADYKNLKRRALVDHELSLQRNMQPLLDELLLVLDFLDMALTSPAESPETKNLVLGVQMTRTKFVQALEASEVAEIPTDGPFDPAIHDAADTEVVPEADPGTIVRTLRRGYTWQGRVLRPAQVVVAAGDSADAGEDADAKDESSSEPTE